ncbi:hypothetical protein [Leptospira idonii]|uniref:Uncharacterized protein n=1 Tax=Leptospira idonii TaxID=1193500 RepID=A0A4V3JYE6_9LEPT|nr:hypothetical protein [Leptospira idonii]TGN20786.1 hypothetical protein EHS15_01755 [Leptospira idonii]
MKHTIDLQLFARAQSWNAELKIDADTVYVQNISEVSEGEEGRIDVVDGDRKYKIGDQIFDVGEITATVLMKNKTERRDYDLLNEFAKGKPKDVFLTFRDSQGVPQLTYLLSNCGCHRGKKNAYDRKSKAEDTHTFILTPEAVKEVA